MAETVFIDTYSGDLDISSGSRRNWVQPIKRAVNELGLDMRRERPGYDLEDGEVYVINRRYAEGQYVGDIDGFAQIPTVQVDDGLDGLPKPPFVVKDRVGQNGFNKYLVEDDEHADNFLKWVSAHPSNAQQYDVQPFVETPSDFATSFRLYMDATGTAHGAGLYHSGIEAGEKRPKLDDLGREYQVTNHTFLDPKSQYYLGESEFRSNKATGGEIIPLTHDDYGSPPLLRTRFDREMLDMHGIADGRVSGSMADTARQIAQMVGPQLGIMFSVDFLVDTEGKERVLELNAPAGMTCVALSNSKYVDMPWKKRHDLIVGDVVAGVAAAQA